jgi:hypothetical protein
MKNCYFLLNTFSSFVPSNPPNTHSIYPKVCYIIGEKQKTLVLFNYSVSTAQLNFSAVSTDLVFLCLYNKYAITIRRIVVIHTETRMIIMF